MIPGLGLAWSVGAEQVRGKEPIPGRAGVESAWCGEVFMVGREVSGGTVIAASQ